MDEIFSATIREGKGLPEFTGTDDYSVHLRIRLIFKIVISYYFWKNYE